MEFKKLIDPSKIKKRGNSDPYQLFTYNSIAQSKDMNKMEQMLIPSEETRWIHND